MQGVQVFLELAPVPVTKIAFPSRGLDQIGCEAQLKHFFSGLLVLEVVSLPDLGLTYTLNTRNKSGDDCDELDADWMTVC